MDQSTDERDQALMLLGRGFLAALELLEDACSMLSDEQADSLRAKAAAMIPLDEIEAFNDSLDPVAASMRMFDRIVAQGQAEGWISRR